MKICTSFEVLCFDCQSNIASNVPDKMSMIQGVADVVDVFQDV
jgi:hypothetical protein